MWYCSTVVPILRKERDSFFVLIQRETAQAQLNYYCSDSSEQGSLKAEFGIQKKHSPDFYIITIDCRGMERYGSWHCILSQGKFFKLCRKPSGFTLLEFTFPDGSECCLSSRPVLGAGDGLRCCRDTQQPQNFMRNMTGRRRSRDTQESSLQVAKNESEEGCCASDSKEGACAKQQKRLQFLCFVVNLMLNSNAQHYFQHLENPS